MKPGKFRYVLLAMLALMLSTDLQAQFKIYTKKARLADFPAKTTMVVLTGDDLLDLSLRNEIKSRWRVSPFDFCYEEDLEQILKDPNVYLLRLEEDKSGIVFLSLEKCGNDKGVSSLESRMEVVRVPFCPKELSSGREVVYISAMIDVMQHYIENSLIHEHFSYQSLAQSGKALSKGRRKKIYIDREDLSEAIAGRDSIQSPADGIVFTDSYTTDSLFTASSHDSLIGFCISSSAPGPKSLSYQVIVSADRHELLYYRKNKYRKEGDKGFTLKSLAAIHTEHSYRK